MFCLQSSTYSGCSFINHKYLTAKTAATSANCSYLPSDQLSSDFLHIFFLSVPPFTSHTSSVSLFLHCFPVCWPCFMVVWLNWCFFFPLFLRALHGMPDGLQTHVPKTFECLCVMLLACCLGRKNNTNITYCMPSLAVTCKHVPCWSFSPNRSSNWVIETVILSSKMVALRKTK